MKIGSLSNGEKGLAEQVGEHFGRVPTHTVIDIESNDVRVVSNISHHMSGRGDPPEILAREQHAFHGQGQHH